MQILLRDFKSDGLDKIKKFLDQKKGPYYFFRTQSLKLQKRFTELMNPDDMPLVFLHGNPHVDNYARTSTGCGMIDFDRSRIGPYAWDLVRLLSSLSLRQKEHEAVGLKKNTLQAVFDAYISRIEDPRLGYEQLSSLKNEKPKKWQLSTNAYLDANKKWAKKMRENPIEVDDPQILALFKGYSKSRNKIHYLEKFTIEEAGVCQGSLGKPRFLVVLKPKAKGQDNILIDMKEVYNDPDTDYFYNPYIRHGHRMVEASQLYAPGVEQRIGYASLGGQEYWVRQIPPFQVKVKGMLKDKVVEEFAHCVAAQLGIGHSRSLLFAKAEKLKSHFKKNFSQMVDVAEKLADESVKAHRIYSEGAKAELKSVLAKKIGRS